jgi:hypothetical protein
VAGRFPLYTDADINGPVVEACRELAGTCCWPRAHYARMTPGDFVEAFEDLARQDDPFAYPIIHVKPRK